MTLNFELWYVHWFFWCCQVLDRFWLTEHGRWSYGREKRFKFGTNLCQFFRIIFFGTLIAAIVFGAYAYIFFVAVVLPFLLFAPLSIGFAVAVVIGIIAGVLAFIALVWGCVVTIGKTADHFGKKKLNQTDDKPGFVKVLIHYLVSVKQRFCPMISFSGGNTDV